VSSRHAAIDANEVDAIADEILRVTIPIAIVPNEFAFAFKGWPRGVPPAYPILYPLRDIQAALRI
jgi:hypothetical protein